VTLQKNIKNPRKPYGIGKQHKYFSIFLPSSAINSLKKCNGIGWPKYNLNAEISYDTTSTQRQRLHSEFRSLFLSQRCVWVTSLPLQSPQTEAGRADGEACL